MYVGCGQGEWVQDTQMRYVGYGGDFSIRPRSRDYTCIICGSLLGLLLLLGALLSLLCWPSNEIDCISDAEDWEYNWGKGKQAYCCRTTGVGCATPDPGPVGPVGPVDPFNCEDDFASWQSDWSVEKKKWCCNVHRRGCGSTADVPASSYDCNSGLANFVKAWSDSKKTWCCSHSGQGCMGDMSAAEASNSGYGAGAKYGDRGAPVAAIR